MLKRWLSRLFVFARRDDGMTSTQYALFVALIAIMCLTAVTTMGKKTRKVFKAVLKAPPTSGS